METTEDSLELKVTRVGRVWIGALKVNGVVNSNMACNKKCDIGYMCREMLRWFDKLGGNSKWARSARKRQCGMPSGKVWRIDD